MNEVDDHKVVCLLFLFHFLLSRFNFYCLNIKCCYCNRGNRQCHNTMNLHWLVLDTYFGSFIQRDSSDRLMILNIMAFSILCGAFENARVALQLRVKVDKLYSMAWPSNGFYCKIG